MDSPTCARPTTELTTATRDACDHSLALRRNAKKALTFQTTRFRQPSRQERTGAFHLRRQHSRLARVRDLLAVEYRAGATQRGWRVEPLFAQELINVDGRRIHHARPDDLSSSRGCHDRLWPFFDRHVVNAPCRVAAKQVRDGESLQIIACEHERRPFSEREDSRYRLARRSGVQIR